MKRADRSVFLNVPFDRRYRKVLNALVFAIHDCGFFARCALEVDDGAEVRAEKLYNLIERCPLGIHGLSRTTLDGKHRLPRFNMPLELGLFLGARRFGSGMQRRKCCLILDTEPYRYQIFCSDIAGQDIRAHHNGAAQALTAVRNWLQSASPSHRHLRGPVRLLSRYVEFSRHLPLMCQRLGSHPSALTFRDYRNLVDAWVSEIVR